MQPYELNAPVSRLEEHTHHRFERVGWGAAGLALLAVSAQALAAPHVFTLTRTLLAGLAAGGIWLTLLKWRRAGRAATANPGERESALVRPTEVFLPHELPWAELQALLRLLDGQPLIERACLVRRQTSGPSEAPVFVLGLDIQCSLFQTGRAAANRQIVQNLVGSIRLPGPVLVFVAEGNCQLLGKTLVNFPGSAILNRRA